MKYVIKNNKGEYWSGDYWTIPQGAKRYLREDLPKTIEEHYHIQSEACQQPVNSLESDIIQYMGCLLYTSPSPRDRQKSRMPSSA